MGDRTFKPSARTPRAAKIALAVITIVMLGSLGTMLFSMVGLLRRLASSDSSVITRLGPSLAMMAVVAIVLPFLMWFSFRRAARAEWVLSDVGIVTAPGFGQPFGLAYTWDSAIEIDYRPISMMTNRDAVVRGSFLSASQQLMLNPQTMYREDFQAVVAAIRAYAPAETVSPNVLVLDDVLRLSAKLLANGGARFAAVDAAVGDQRLEDARRKLAKARAQEPSNSQLLPVLDLMRAQVEWLRGKPREAHTIAGPLAERFPTWREACFVAGLAAAATGDTQRAEQLITSATGTSSATSAGDTVEAVEQRGRASRAQSRWLLIGGAVYVALTAAVITMPLYVTGDTFDNPVVSYVMKSMPTLLIIMQLMIVLAGTVFATRKRRAAAAKREERLDQQQVPQPMMLPESVAHIEAARQQVWAAVALFVGAAAVLGVTQLISTLWPQLLAGSNGYLWAQRTFAGVSYVVMMLAAVLLIRAVGAGALEREPRTAGTKTAATSLLNADIKPGWAAGALVPAVSFAIGAFLLSTWDPAVVQYLDVDAAGNRYGIMGDSVVVWNAAGTEVREFGYKGPDGANIPWDLAVADDGTVYITDAENTRVCAYDTSGRVVATLTAESDPLLRDPDEFNLSCAVDGDDVLLLDAGLLARVSGSERTKVFSDKRLFFAEDFDLVGDGVVVADTNYGRLMYWDAGKWTSSDCLTLPDGYRYPVHVAASEDGPVYAVLAKPWDKYEANRKVGRRLSAYRPPDVWMGRLYRWDSPEARPVQIPVVYRNTPVNVGDVAVLEDGRLLVASLNEGWIYEVDPEDPSKIVRVDTGAIGRRLLKADRMFRITWAGPQVLFALAVVVPIAVGMTGVLIGRRKRKSQDDGGLSA